MFRALAQAWAPRQALYPGSYVDLSPSTAVPAVTYVDTDRQLPALSQAGRAAARERKPRRREPCRPRSHAAARSCRDAPRRVVPAGHGRPREVPRTQETGRQSKGADPRCEPGRRIHPARLRLRVRLHAGSRSGCRSAVLAGDVRAGEGLGQSRPSSRVTEPAALPAALPCDHLPVGLCVGRGPLVLPDRDDPGTALRTRTLHVSAPLRFIHHFPQET